MKTMSSAVTALPRLAIDGLLQQWHGFFALAAVEQSEAAQARRLRIARLELQRRAVGFQGVVEPPRLVRGHAALQGFDES